MKYKPICEYCWNDCIYGIIDEKSFRRICFCWDHLPYITNRRYSFFNLIDQKWIETSYQEILDFYSSPLIQSLESLLRKS